MFQTITPTAGTPYTIGDVGRALLGFFEDEKVLSDFKNEIKEYLDVENVRLVNSGTTACYILLKLFKNHSELDQKNEIILPDYTAPSLLLPIREAGLKAVVVDTDPNNFNIDISKIEQHINPKTLAIMPVHMFGIPTRIQPILDIAKDKDIFVFEDAASSMGSTIQGTQTGALAPFGFYSLNRGKNISTLSGGIITWKDDKYTASIDTMVNNLPELSYLQKFLTLIKITGLSLAVRPPLYTLLYFLISKYKYSGLHTDFESHNYTKIQAAKGKNLWKRVQKLTQQRIVNGKKLYSIFQDRSSIQPPSLPKNTEIAFNQFPVLFEDLDQRAVFRKRLLKKGIETSLMYKQALHQIYPELNQNGNYKNAEYLAEHLLLIPPHSQVNDTYLSTVKKTLDDLDL